MNEQRIVTVTSFEYNRIVNKLERVSCGLFHSPSVRMRTLLLCVELRQLSRSSSARIKVK